MDQENLDIELLKRQIKGKTLKVYLLLARNKDKEFGIREIQRELGFSTVSLAVYHAEKLEEMKLLSKTELGKYKVLKILPIGYYDEFFVLKGRYLPQEVFFVTFFSFILIIASIFMLLQFWGATFIVLLLTVIVSVLKSWYRVNYLWKKKDEEI